MGNYCAKRRFSSSEVDSEARQDSESLTVRGRRKGNVAVTLAITQSLTGERVVLPTLPAGTKMRELRLLVKKEWRMPLVSQRFLLGSDIINGSDADEVADVFHQYLPASETEILEISCIRCSLEPEDREAVNNLLLQATASGDIEQMKEALSEGADPNCRTATPDESGSRGFDIRRHPSAMMFALAAGDNDAVAVLKEANAEMPEGEPLSPSFNVAFRLRDFSSVVELLRRGADPNTRLRRGEGVQDTDSGSPLHAMCAMHQVPGAVPVVLLLLRMRADPDAKDGEGDSPLAHAKYFGAKEIHAVLQSHGAKLGGPYYSTVHRAGRAVLGWR